METWTGDLIGRMHNARVSNGDLAEELGVSSAYVSMVLNCKRKPIDAERRFNAALSAIIGRRK